MSTEDQKPIIEVIPYKTPDFNIKVIIHVQVNLTGKAIDEYLKQEKILLN